MFSSRQMLAGLGLVLIASVATSSRAANLAVFDATVFNGNGFTFSDFTAPGAVGVSGGLINIDIATDSDGVNGLFGGLGSDVSATFNTPGISLEVTLRVDPLNLATDFRVVLTDADTDLTGDEFQFFFDLTGVTPGQLVTLTQDLSNPGPVFVQPQFGKFPGDEIQNYGLTQIQLQSAFQGTNRLRIDLESIKIVDPDNPLIAELTPATYRASNSAFTFGSFGEPGAADFSGEAFILNADPTTSAGTGGGIGFTGLSIDFDATQAAIEVQARLLPGNAATAFNILLGDNDGDDSAPGLGSEDFIFTVDTANFNETGLTTFTIPLGSGSESSIEQTFGFANGGDGLQNFDLSQIQIQAADELGLLGIEIARVSIVEALIAAGLAGDYNNSGSVEQGDLDLVLNNWGGPRTAGFVANADGFATANVDQEELDRVLNNWGSSNAPSFAGSSVPEPALAAVLASAGLLLRRRRVA